MTEHVINRNWFHIKENGGREVLIDVTQILWVSEKKDSLTTILTFHLSEGRDVVLTDCNFSMELILSYLKEMR